MVLCVCVCVNHSVTPNSLQPQWIVACQAPLSMEFSRQEFGVHCLLQGIFSTQGLNLGLLHCKQILYYLSHQGSPHKSLAHV